tara:strand:+ start:2824 stop:3228 length:405 start_codon:yes stop_codon:yes gene_type:complete
MGTILFPEAYNTDFSSDLLSSFPHGQSWWAQSPDSSVLGYRQPGQGHWQASQQPDAVASLTQSGCIQAWSSAQYLPPLFMRHGQSEMLHLCLAKQYPDSISKSMMRGLGQVLSLHWQDQSTLAWSVQYVSSSSL